jgi:DNA-directed RNA polymerase subunit K/omega
MQTKKLLAGRRALSLRKGTNELGPMNGRAKTVIALRIFNAMDIDELTYATRNSSYEANKS